MASRRAACTLSAHVTLRCSEQHKLNTLQETQVAMAEAAKVRQTEQRKQGSSEAQGGCWGLRCRELVGWA